MPEFLEDMTEEEAWNDEAAAQAAAEFEAQQAEYHTKQVTVCCDVCAYVDIATMAELTKGGWQISGGEEFCPQHRY